MAKRVQSEDRHKRSEPQQPQQIQTDCQKFKPLKALTPAQDRHIKAMKSQVCVPATGPAGTGKTYVMASYAAQQLRDREVEQIIVTRPTVEAGATKLGFLKGTLNEKMEPYLWPFLKGFHSQLGRTFYEYLIKPDVERIKVVPFQYMQGISPDHAIILCDEAENATVSELKMLLTRLGEGTRVFLAGDISQSMTRDSGYAEAISTLKRAGVPGITHIEYTIDDNVRSEFTRRVVEAFENISYRDDKPRGVFAP